MNPASCIFLALFSIVFLTAAEEASPVSAYDVALAEELGADEYGMRAYVFVILKTGPAEIDDEKRREELFAGHFSNMEHLADERKLVVAGPFIDGDDNRGLFIFNTASIEDAEALVNTDPAVAAGVFTAELTKFYGSAALMKINELHRKIQKKKP